MADKDQTTYEDEELAAPLQEDAVPDAEAAAPDADDAASVHGAAFSDDADGGFLSRVRWGRIALAILFAFLLVAAVLFTWNRWYRYDDAQDIQGTWRDASTGKLLELDASLLKIDNDVVYEYTIDTFGKTIAYRLGEDEGHSSYRFSENRQLLVLEDGVGTDWGLVFHFRDDPGFAEGELPEGMSRLEKVSSDVPSLGLPGSSRDRKPITSSGSGIGARSSSSSSSSSTASSAAAGGAAGTTADGTASSGASAGGAASSGSSSSSSVVIPDEELHAMANGLLTYNEKGMLGYYNSQGVWVDSVQNQNQSANGASANGTGQGSGGYYDAQGNWISGTVGHFDAMGNWLEGPGGYYDAQGNWVDTTISYPDAQGSGTDGTAAQGTDAYGYDATGTYGYDTTGTYGYDATGAYGYGDAAGTYGYDAAGTNGATGTGAAGNGT